MSTGICDICKRWDSDLIEGACPECRGRFNLDTPSESPPADANDQEELTNSPYTKYLAERVEDALGDICSLPSQSVIRDIITEALFNAAQDIRRGKSVNLEHIGTLFRTDSNHVAYSPDDWVLPKSEEEKAA